MHIFTLIHIIDEIITVEYQVYSLPDYEVNLPIEQCVSNLI